MRKVWHGRINVGVDPSLAKDGPTRSIHGRADKDLRVVVMEVAQVLAHYLARVEQSLDAGSESSHRVEVYLSFTQVDIDLEIRRLLHGEETGG